MAVELPLLEVSSRADWRRWLAKNCEGSSGVWLVFHKAHTGKRPIDYESAVQEALCFGWIDSTVRRIDENRYAQKFTPRKETSVWSDTNRRRFAELERQGLIAPQGLARSPTSRRPAPPVKLDEIPRYITARFRKAGVLKSFNSLAPSHRREYVGWIDSAKREETRERRLLEAVTLLKAGRKLGMK